MSHRLIARFLLCALAFTAIHAAEPAQQTATVTGDAVRLRDQPTQEGSEVLGKLNKGDQVQVLARPEDKAPWVQVYSEQLQKEGWIHGDYISISDLAPTRAINAAPLRTRLANMTFPTENVFGGSAKLKDGKYEEPDNSTFIQLGEDLAEGDLDGDGDSDAAVTLISNTGGTGMFIDLYVFENKDGDYAFANSTFLGDRIKINGMRVENNKLIVDMLTHGEEEPLCCPTHPFIATYDLLGKNAKPSSLREIKITDSGVGGLNAKTPFDKDAIAKEFPAFDVEEMSYEVEGGMMESLLISSEGQIVAEVFPNEARRIYSIVFTGGNVALENDVRLGSVFTDNPIHATLSCVPGMEEMSGYCICESPETPHVKYVYTPVNYTGPDGELPPVDVVNKSTLSQLVWQAED